MNNKLEALISSLNEKNINKSNICIEISKVYVTMSLYNDALKYLFLALDEQDCSNKGNIFFEIGKVYFFQNNFKKAIEYFNCSLDIINIESDIYIHLCFLLSKAYKKIKEYKKSSSIICMLNKNHTFTEEEKSIYKQNLNEYDRYPGQYEFNGDYNELVNVYLNVLEGNPDDKQVLCFLAQTYNLLGLYDKTIFLYKQNKDKVKDNKFFNNKFLNEYEIASKQTILKSKPRNMMVVLSNKCNLTCIMCRAIQNKWEIPQERLKEIKDLFPYLERVLWQGGEILLLPYFKDLLKESLKYPNIKQAILTNFQLADDEIINLIVKNNIELRISIDGVEKNIYEKIRRGGSFQKLIDNINLLNDVREKNNTQMSLNLSIVVMRENYDKLVEFVDFAHKYNFNLITFNKIEYGLNDKSTESEKNFALEQDIFTYNSNDEIKYLAFQVMLAKEKAKEYNIQIEFRFDVVKLTQEDIKKFSCEKDTLFCKEAENNIEINSICQKEEKITDISNISYEQGETSNIENEKKEEDKNKFEKIYNNENADKNLLNQNIKLLCHLPWNTLTFYYDGSVRPDCLCDINKIVGHLKDSTIEELWNNKQMQVYRKNVAINNIDNWCSSNCIQGRVVESYLKLL